MNLVFIFADQMRGQDMGHVGNPDVLTPHMDRLAAQGVSFTNAIANFPVCTPSRGSMLTGLHPFRHGAVANDLPLRTDVKSIGTLLKQAGYATGYVGKWHLDGVPRNGFTPPGPRRSGFDDYWAAWNCAHAYFDGQYYEEQPVPCSIEGYEPDGQTDLALRFLEQNQNRRFALFLSWGPPHDPYAKVPDQFRNKYEPSALTLRPNVIADDAQPPVRETLACYYAAITALDANLGRLTAAMDAMGLSENTLVVFTSDHGDMLWSHGREKKQWPWEESVRIPLVIRASGKLPADSRPTTLVSILDLVPTLLGLLDMPIPQGLDGIDVLPYVRGERAEGGRSALIGIPVPVDEAIRYGMRPWRGVRTDRHTYARWPDGTGWLLYDNQEDPYQMENLITRPETGAVRRELEGQLKTWFARTGDDFLSWETHIRQLDLTKKWNLRERELRSADDCRLL